MSISSAQIIIKKMLWKIAFSSTTIIQLKFSSVYFKFFFKFLKNLSKILQSFLLFILQISWQLLKNLLTFFRNLLKFFRNLLSRIKTAKFWILFIIFQKIFCILNFISNLSFSKILLSSSFLQLLMWIT